ncbi:VPLPA-CTERM sorting domain-containing protein [Sulfitobacter sp. F26169L]|uniref:VPLPA-CTERM sorting domain-containing protein n=1 Tax=Sulfitobacter sp. F26169L TaxID=2996015 RepID=UPI002260A6D9|nr:VPLPA-CTERM sorting domain-containing protein [Sulfitobacter sp. F26169L]MCX7568165.1 VPLPA-CTERM sorting domain-containing protein [Sulfitobacter sp. F26169L]
MNIKTLATAAGMSLATATASFAAPLDFDFSFTDGTNTITGLIEGLDSDGIGQTATQITVVGIIDTYIFTSFNANYFDVTSGVVDVSTVGVVSASSVDGETTTGEATSFELGGGFGPGLEECTGGCPMGLEFTSGPAGSEIFTAVSSVPLPAVPLPAGGLLLLSGLLGVAGLKRRKKSAA